MSIKQPSSAGPNSQAPATQLNSNAPMPTAQAQVDIHGQTTAYPLPQQQYSQDWNQSWGDPGNQSANQYGSGAQYGSTGNYDDGTRNQNW